MEEMVRVMATGVFDILHLGHIHYLEAARAMGDELVVVVASDSTVKRRKHTPINTAEVRTCMVQALKPVTMAVQGKDGDPLDIVEELKPDIIAIGYDQDFKEKKLEEDLTQRGISTRVVRTGHFDSDLDGTRKIMYSITKRFTEGSIYSGTEEGK